MLQCSNNGVANYIGQIPIHDGNTISLSYNGSVGQAFYQPDAYWATDDVNALYFKKSNHHEFNQYIGLFIATLLKQEQYRFSYGRKWVLSEMEDTVLKLPQTSSGKPDWDWMENYIKSLPYSDRIFLKKEDSVMSRTKKDAHILNIKLASPVYGELE